MSQEEKIKRRLARKAELARQSRRRKKAYVESLEMKIEELSTKVLELQGRRKDTSASVALALCAMAELQQAGSADSHSTSDKSEAQELESISKLETESSDSGHFPQQTFLDTPAALEKIELRINFVGATRSLTFLRKDLTFQSLQEAVLREFLPFEKNPATVTAWYVDEEDDPILITSTPELLEAHRLASMEKEEPTWDDLIGLDDKGRNKQPVGFQIHVVIRPVSLSSTSNGSYFAHCKSSLEVKIGQHDDKYSDLPTPLSQQSLTTPTSTWGINVLQDNKIAMPPAGGKVKMMNKAAKHLPFSSGSTPHSSKQLLKRKRTVQDLCSLDKPEILALLSAKKRKAF
uniref:PB1 domain-containing protein n=2 Tax=Lotharella globosa TaxID=91324 RepID=A0A7S3ZAS7_9EUKA|mmetsp:Transcript_4453/g.8678  ORF Transcript_4453/g.8678 Transcript_4453/m.8678 type:complete len:346 (+) Transcript_4453:105-1142(+)